MADTNRTMTTKVNHRNQVRLPSSVVDEQGLVKGSPVDVLWGHNYQVVILIPHQAELGNNQRERIRILCNKPLDTKD